MILSRPERLRQARATICSPEIALRLPSATASAWFALKAARGQAVSWDRAARLAPAHLVRDPDTGVVACIDAVRARVVPRIHARAQQLAAAIRDGGAA